MLQHLVQRLSVVRRSYVPNHRQQLDYKFSRICALVTHRVEMQRARMMTMSDNVVKALGHRLEREKKRMQLMESVMNAYDPVNVLKKGYSITMKDGKAVTDGRQVKAGNVLVTYLKDGEIKYDNGIARLEEIVREIEDNSLPVDVLVDRLKEAKEIAKKCKDVLFKVEDELKRLTENETE